MPNVLVTGAANGLGAEFIRVFRSKSDYQVFAFDQSPIDDSMREVVKVQGDITSSASLATLQERLNGAPIHLLIHSVGIRGLVPTIEVDHPGDVARAETWTVMNGDTISRTFQINALATFSLIKTLLLNLEGAVNEKEGRFPKVIIMSSRMGSIGQNTSGGAYAYRASKAALNAMIRSFSIDVPNVTFLMVHPGRVETRLTKCREEGAMEPRESVQSMVKLIDFVGRPHSGKFVDRFGVEIPW